MALNKTKLQNDFYDIFDTMNHIYKNGEEYMATRCADVIDEYISNGLVSTVDSGTGSVSGTYVGNGTGTMKINASNLRNLLLNTILNTKNNDELAQKLASNIHIVCTSANTISTTTKGTTTPPTGTTQPDAGVGRGSFTSTSSIISSKLRACFLTMDKLAKGGNMYFAQEWANAIDDYMKSGMVNVILQPPMSGAGSGTIS